MTLPHVVQNTIVDGVADGDSLATINADLALLAPVNTWRLSTNVLVATSDSVGAAVFSETAIQGAVTAATAVNAAFTAGTNPLGQGTWLVWETTSPTATILSGPNMGDPVTLPEDIVRPFLVNLPTFLHGGDHCPEGSDCEGEDCDYCLEPQWIYEVHVFPKQAPDPDFEKELIAWEPRSRMINDRVQEYSLLHWQITIAMETTFLDLYPVFVPFTRPMPASPADNNFPGRPEEMRNNIRGPLAQAGYGPGTPVTRPGPATEVAGWLPGWPTTWPATPLPASDVNMAAHRIILAVEDPLDPRTRIADISNITVYYTNAAGVQTPMPAAHFMIVQEFRTDDPAVAPGPTPNPLNPLPGTPILPAPTGEAIWTGAYRQIVWVYFLESAADYLAGADLSPAVERGLFDGTGQFEINMTVEARVDSPEYLGQIMNEALMQYGPRRGTITGNNRGENRFVPMTGISINKINPSNQPLDGAVFYLFPRSYLYPRVPANWYMPEDDGGMTDAARQTWLAANPPQDWYHPTAAGTDTILRPHPIDDLVLAPGLRAPVRRAITGPGPDGTPGAVVGVDNSISWVDIQDARFVGEDFSPARLIQPIAHAANLNASPITPAVVTGQGILSGVAPGIYYLVERLAPPGGYRRIEAFERIVITHPALPQQGDCPGGWPGYLAVESTNLHPATGLTYFTYVWHDALPCTCEAPRTCPGAAGYTCFDVTGTACSTTNCDNCLHTGPQTWTRYLRTNLTITNTRDFVLPLTGGAGTLMFTAAGVSLMGGAGLFLFLARKKDKQKDR
jgi:LPXTG-motif cell wall-anchored protein